MPDWTISQHAFRCGCCDAWVAQGERIARVRLRWWCQSCAERLGEGS